MKNLILLVYLVGVTACSVTVPDVPVCAEINLSKGYCVNTISSDEYVIDDLNPRDGQTWWDMRQSMIMVPSASWAKLKAFIIKVCRRTGKCDIELGNWERTVEKIDTKIAVPK